MKITAAITGVGGYIPEYILTNDELSHMVDTTDQWIVEHTGIRERHILKGEGMGTSVMATKAVEELLKKTNTPPDEIDLLICPTVTGDMIFPSTACIVSDKTNIRNAFAFDINAGCSGFLYGLTVAKSFIETGARKKAIVVASEKMSSITDYTDRKTPVWRRSGSRAGRAQLRRLRHTRCNATIRRRRTPFLIPESRRLGLPAHRRNPAQPRAFYFPRRKPGI